MEGVSHKITKSYLNRKPNSNINGNISNSNSNNSNHNNNNVVGGVE